MQLVAKKAATNKRGSPEAIAKRRAARAFNDLLDPSGGSRLDGRTEKRRQRLMAELASGKTRGSGKPLKPVDVLAHVSELLELGESLANIRKTCRPRAAVVTDPKLIDTLARLHRAYGFPPEAYAMLGIAEDSLRRAGITGGKAKRQAPPAEEEPARPPRAPRRRRSES